MPKPLDRTGEDEKTIRARLVYQSRKRGMLEGDLLLSTFARDHLGTMSMGEMREFDKVSLRLGTISSHPFSTMLPALLLISQVSRQEIEAALMG